MLDVLRLGVHQLLATRVAPHAAVDESVELAASAGKGSATGFANGVLRTISRSTPGEWRERALSGLAATSGSAVEYSHPVWVVAAFRAALAAEGRADELEELLAADNDPPAVTMVALPGLATVAEVGEPGGVSPVGARSAGGDPAAIPVVASGRARVQDEGSQLAALALSRARPIVEGERWLDLCAGPGGKTALLAAEALPGARCCVANELVPGAGAPRAQRARRVRSGAGRARRRRHAVRDARPGRVRPHPARRPVHRPRRAAPPAGGAVAQAARRRPRADAIAGRAARCGGRRPAPRRHPRLRHLLAAPRRDARRRRRGARAASRA